MNASAWQEWIPQPPAGRDVGVRKPHISFSRFADGSLMFEVNYWPNWPNDTEGTSFSAGDDLSDAWAAHMQQFEECEEDELTEMDDPEAP